MSSMRSLEYLSMEKQAQRISDGMYIYRHRREGGVEIHDIFVKKSTTRLLLSWVGKILLLANVCCTLLSKESLCLSSLWSISFSGIIAKYLRYDPVKKESLVIMPTFGVQLEQHFWSGRVYRKFVPIDKILIPVLNEHVTAVKRSHVTGAWHCFYVMNMNSWLFLRDCIHQSRCWFRSGELYLHSQTLMALLLFANHKIRMDMSNKMVLHYLKKFIEDMIHLRL